MKTDFSVLIPMRDKIVLSTIISKPTEGSTFPVFLVRTPYSAKKIFGVAKKLVETFKSAVILQDCRGRYDSGGEFKVFEEKEDTIDTIKWIQKQEWFNGELHVFGPSYLGYVGLQVLDEKGLKIKTIFAPKVLGDVKDSIHCGDILQFHWALPWSIMTSTRVQSPLTIINGSWPEVYYTAYEGKLEDAVKNIGWPDQIWKLFLTPVESSIWEKYDINGKKPIEPRICLVGGWYDFLLNATLKTYSDLMERGGQKPDLIIGPWSHNGYLASQAGIENWEFGRDGKGDFSQDLLEFLEREKNYEHQFIKTFVLRANKWIRLESWPPKQVSTQKLFLNENQMLLDHPPEDEPVELVIDVDINNPVPTLGGVVWESYDPVEPGPRDQSSLKDRKDILNFYTNPFESERIILGPLSALLWGKAEVPETHFTAKLTVVDKENTERIFQDGIQRVLGITNDYNKIKINILASGIEIRKGEKLGLEISWSNFPKYCLPPKQEKYNQSILSSSETPSYVIISFLKK